MSIFLMIIAACFFILAIILATGSSIIAGMEAMICSTICLVGSLVINEMKRLMPPQKYIPGPGDIKPPAAPDPPKYNIPERKK